MNPEGFGIHVTLLATQCSLHFKNVMKNKFIAYIYIRFNQKLDEKSSLRVKIEAVEHYHNIFKNTQCSC